MADSLVAGFRAKYTFDHWRPVTVIRGSGNSASEPLLVTPPHPEYPSAHCLGAGAAVAVLRDFLGKDQFSAAFVYPPLGVLARWETLSQLALTQSELVPKCDINPLSTGVMQRMQLFEPFPRHMGVNGGGRDV